MYVIVYECICGTIGLTFRSGVTVDCTWNKLRMDAGTYWLNLYTMLSRATSLKNLFLFMAQGPKTYKDNSRGVKINVRRNINVKARSTTSSTLATQY